MNSGGVSEFCCNWTIYIKIVKKTADVEKLPKNKIYREMYIYKLSGYLVLDHSLGNSAELIKIYYSTFGYLELGNNLIQLSTLLLIYLKHNLPKWLWSLEVKIVYTVICVSDISICWYNTLTSTRPRLWTNQPPSSIRLSIQLALIWIFIANLNKKRAQLGKKCSW